MIKVVTGAEMRAIEGRAKAYGLSVEALIDRAGAALASIIAERAPQGAIVVLAGPGNNGSDGLAAARRLDSFGRTVRIVTFRRDGVGDFSGDVVRCEDDAELYEVRRLLSESHVVVDCLLGTGQSRPPEGLLAGLLAAAEERPSRVLAVAADVPTGVDADTGRVHPRAFRADITVCMGFPKRGVVIYPGADYAGAIRVADLGIPMGLAGDIQVSLPADGDIAELLPRRSSDGNKGSSGRVLFVGGSQDFVGAPAMAALGAYRAGAGLVEIAVPRPIQAMIAAHALEPVFRPLPDTGGQIGPDVLPELRRGIERARAMIVGPGLGLSETTIAMTKTLLATLRESDIQVLIDADGLNALSKIEHWWPISTPAILTPHPGEMSRLTGMPVEEIQHDRIGVAQRHAAQWRVVVVLKGAGTVVASPDGTTVVNPTGGPNLATAGTGDVLSGIIGGLLAQGCSPWSAAVAGVYLHGRAGDIWRAEHGEVGMVASDLLDNIPAARVSILGTGGVNE